MMRRRASYYRRLSIGRYANVRYEGQVVRVTVVDVYSGHGRVKRVRVQTPGALQGRVLMPNEYEFVEFLSK